MSFASPQMTIVKLHVKKCHPEVAIAVEGWYYPEPQGLQYFAPFLFVAILLPHPFNGQPAILYYFH